MVKIVLADDEEAIRDLLAKKINSSGRGYSVVAVAENGEEALEKIRSLKPEILLTDICMPGMDGLQLVRQAAAADRLLKTVIISGYDNFSYAKTAMSLGVRDYLLKPFSQDELLSVLDKIALEIENAEKLRAEAAVSPVFYTPEVLKKYCGNRQPRSGDLEERLLVFTGKGYAETALEIFDSLLKSYSELMRGGHETLVFMILAELILNISSITKRSGNHPERESEALLDKLKENFSGGSLLDTGGGIKEFIIESCKAVNLSGTNQGIKAVNIVKDLIEKNLGDENFRLEKAAEKIYFSPSYIRQLFRRVTGESFTEYLIRRRMETAARLIMIPEYRIQDVAEHTGYNNQRYFSICFKKYYHCTPSEYRKKAGTAGNREPEFPKLPVP